MISALHSDQQLLKLIRAKSRIGAEALYDQYSPVLRLVIFRIVRQKDITDIVLEKTIHKIWDTSAHYNEQQVPLLTWMLIIAKSISKEYAVKEDQLVVA
jgi:DNA-directed RNA polymerase specialized sigma24 family protein